MPVLGSGLYGYYTFEGSAENVIDGAPDAVEMENPRYVEGLGDGEAIDLHNGSLRFSEPMIDGGSYTISFWAKDINDGIVYSVESRNKWGIGFVLDLQRGVFYYATDGYEYNYGMSTFYHKYLEEGWNMITVTSDYTPGVENAQINLYINGSLVDTIYENGVGYQNVYYGEALLFQGNMIIDNLRIYNEKVLKKNQVKRIYDAEK